MRPASAFATLVAVVLTACGPQTPTAEPTRGASVLPSIEATASLAPSTPSAGEVQGIWIAVYGPANSKAPGDLVLEVGETAWYGYGGVVSVVADKGLKVRLVERGSCRIYAELVAPPETMWVIRFNADGSVTTKAVDDMDAGPALSARPPSGCP